MVHSGRPLGEVAGGGEEVKGTNALAQIGDQTRMVCACTINFLAHRS